MNILFDQILQHREAAALPSLSESGGLPALISGLGAVHRANLAAALKARTGRPLVVICPDDSAAESFARDLAVMLGEEAVTLGLRDFTFVESEAVSRGGEQKRLAALWAMLHGASAAVLSVCGAIQRTIPPQILERAAFTIEDGAELPLEDAVDALVRCGYSRCEQVEGPGQFAVRGGILDFFSPGRAEPVRVEFWGDTVDSMGGFDVSDQRRTGQIERCTILPAAETVPALFEGGAAALARELESWAARYERRRTSEIAQKTARSVRSDAEKLAAGIALSCADKYIDLIYPMACAADYFPPDALVFFDQPNRCAEKARDWSAQLRGDVEELARRGESAAAPDGFLLGFDAFVRRLADYPVYMADAFTVGRSPLAPRTLTSISARQLTTYAGNAQAAAEDVAAYLKQDYRVVVLAGDERRARVLRDFFAERGIDAPFFAPLSQLPAPGRCCVSVGAISAGMDYPGIRLCVLSDAQLLRESGRRRAHRTLPSGRQRIESYADLSVGDYVVHENHGIGRFAGIVKMTVDGFEKDYVKICYAGTDSLYVPATQLDLVTKYTGGGEDKEVRLSRMGGAEWARTPRARAARPGAWRAN